MATNPLTPRVNNIETGGVWKVGDVKHSFLTEVQFQAEHDDTWVLCDGQDVTGSDYEDITGNNVVPDVRGQFLRAKNNGRADGQENPDGDVALGTFQADEFKSHTHTIETSTGSSGGSDHAENNSSSTQATYNTLPSGGDETRPKNVTCNMFIKINREPST